MSASFLCVYMTVAMALFTHVPASQAKSNVRRQPSGYIVFAGEIRKQIQQENPDCSFGDISRIVGTRVSNTSVCNSSSWGSEAMKTPCTSCLSEEPKPHAGSRGESPCIPCLSEELTNEDEWLGPWPMTWITAYGSNHWFVCSSLKCLQLQSYSCDIAGCGIEQHLFTVTAK